MTMVYTETKPRGPIFIDFDGPGPAYGLPSMTGTDTHDPRSNYSKGPAHSLAGKRRERKLDGSTPGPKYNISDSLYRGGRSDGVSVSIQGRFKDRSGDNGGPGPGAYSPDSSFLKTGPSYSMGGRHRERSRANDMPGPNAYVPSFAKNEGKGPSLKGRYKESSSKDKTPGPQHYKPSSALGRYGRRTAPEVSLKGRNYPESKQQSKAPGPQAYNPNTEGLSSFKNNPSWSLSSRQKELGGKDKTPGPNTYLPLPPSETASAPAYSLAGKYKPRKETSQDSPGPASYNPDPTVTNRGRSDAAGPSLKGRNRSMSDERNKAPGPQSYNISDVKSGGGPAYSMGAKWSKKEHEDGKPGPNQYYPSFANTDPGPSYSLGGRHKDTDKKSTQPGPGAYNVPADRDKAPAYSMAGKWISADAGTQPGGASPGPASYNPKQGENEGGVSFGVRHSRAKYIPNKA